MNTTLSTKLAALSLALVINGFVMGSVALVFNSQARSATIAVATLATGTGLRAVS